MAVVVIAKTYDVANSLLAHGLDALVNNLWFL